MSLTKKKSYSIDIQAAKTREEIQLEKSGGGASSTSGANRVVM